MMIQNVWLFLDGMKRFIALHSLQESDKFYVEILIVPLKEKMINRTKSKLASELVENSHVKRIPGTHSKGSRMSDHRCLKKRKLTIFGKSCIVNNLAVSKLIYIASILTLPENDFIKKVNRAIFNFIWNKHDRIKRNTLKGKLEECRIGVIDEELKLKALKASWVNMFD